MAKNKTKLPDAAHTSQPWLIHEFTSDFRLEDVWALPTPGDRDEFPTLIAGASVLDPAESSSRLVSGLFALRWWLGGLFGWDDDPGPGDPDAPTLRDRIPADLLESVEDLEFDLPFEPLYFAGDELAAEVANKTVHGVLHLGWVPDGAGGYRGQMAVLVKPNGMFGKAYMAAITPFRYLIYPLAMRDIQRGWEERPYQ